jgi:lipid-A-disaccharide synthase-like uncharacterized protein
MKPKSLFSSRTFYMQLLSICAAITGVIPLAPETTAIVVGLINIALRVVTKDPVRVGL